MAGDTGDNGVCVVCHTATMYHNATSTAPVGHHDNRVCVDCHPHRKGFPSFTTVFNPIKRKLFAWFGAGEAYAKPPAWVTDGALSPGLQNHSLPPQAWASGLKRFRAGYEIVRRSSAQAQSGQPAIKDDIIYYYHNDHLGTPCFLTDEAGAIVWRREQTPFGVTSFERGTTAESLRFPGQYWDDEKQSSYNGFRDSYTPGLGRYTQADPIGQNGGINLYTYVGNMAVNQIDPYGLLSSVEALAHYMGGSGTPMKMHFSEIDTSAVSINYFAQVQAALNGGCKDQIFNINDAEPFSTSGDAALFLGSITLKLKGILHLKCDCTWTFTGFLSSLSDYYDFNASSHRSRKGEALTTLGRHLPGEPYIIYILGQKPINDSGKINGAPTCGMEVMPCH